MLSTPIILLIVVVGLVVASLIAYIATGSIISVFVVLTLAILVAYILQKMGVLVINTANNEIDFHEKIPAPSNPPVAILPNKMISPKEVFYVSGNEYTYDDAAAVCAAYGADLATYDQVNQAFGNGAEWCGYGWTQGGMALYPTQEATWQQMQLELSEKRRTSCGRPGINGGYFDPSNKFGVNCYGERPGDHGTKYPLPVPGEDNKGFNQMVNKFKSMIKRMTVSPFNRDAWSEWSLDYPQEEKRHDKKYTSIE